MSVTRLRYLAIMGAHVLMVLMATDVSVLQVSQDHTVM